MTKLNNSTYVLFASLILDGKATLNDVPAGLKDGVQAELDFFNGAVAEAQAGQTTPTGKPASAAVEATLTVKPSTAKTDETTDQVVSDVNNAVKDAK